MKSKVKIGLIVLAILVAFAAVFALLGPAPQS